MRKGLFFVAATSLVLFVAFKGFVWYETTKAINVLKDVTALHIAIDHGWIGSDLDGEIFIEDVVITPYQLRDSVKIKKVRFIWPSVFDLIKAGIDIQEGRAPPALAIDLGSVVMPLSVVSLSEKLQEKKGPKVFGLACGDIKAMDENMYEQMGYDEFRLDSRLNYVLAGNSLKLDYVIDADAVYEASGSIDIELPSVIADEIGAPTLNSVSFQFSEIAWMCRIADLCKKQKMSADNAVDAETNPVGEVQANVSSEESPALPETFEQASSRIWREQSAILGFTVGPKLQAAYEEFLKGEADIDISFRPEIPLDIAAVPFMSEGLNEKNLGLSLTINRRKVENPNLKFDYQTYNYAMNPELIPVEEPKPKPKKVKPKPRVVNVKELNRYLQTQVKITQKDGKVVQGKLLKVEKFEIEVARRMGGGDVAFHIKKKDIKEAMVNL